MNNLKKRQWYIENFNTTRNCIEAMIKDYLLDNPEETAGGLGWLICMDAVFIGRILNGGDLTTKRLDPLMEFFDTLEKYQETESENNTKQT
ncbi:MAG: hypothetical protein ACUZ8E_18050 [Candidatus Anammoxibacter sp.]